MKNVGIHVLDFNDTIIDFISQSDGALINAEMSMNVEEKTETFDFTIENTRAEKLRERNRIIAQDNNGTFREFIIIHITDNFDGTTEIECNASYLEDLKTAKPIKPGKFEAHTTTQALLKTLADTGWEVSDDTEYGGNRTTSWTSHTNPFDLIYMLCTTYSMVPEFYIELSAHSVEHRYVSIAKPKNLFKGKEITKGKDLTGMTRTIDLSEVKTALLAVGPEKEDGSRIETVITDDEAQEIFGLPDRYIWDVYEPESNDENMTLERLTTLAKTELNKRNQAAISYEVSSLDIHKYYNDVTVHLRDIVRVKDRDFRPPLYIEAEVIGIKYNWLADESEFTFGNVIEYEETKLREFFTRKLDEITKKLNDNISNVNTIVSDVVAGELEYYERKIFKGAEPPENPQNDTLWYDTSNSDVAVLRRYWNGKWITQTADDVEKIGGLRREQVMYRDLNDSFINLTIQHSKLQNDVYDVLNSEYLVDDDLKSNLNQALSVVDNVYQNIKTNLDSMDEETATIGKLVDTQTLFTVYREKLQTLYKYITEAKISIDRRLKLLQSQYTDEKFNEALTKVANKFGLTVDSNNNMVGTPDVVEKAIEASRIDTQEQLKSYVKSVDYETDKNGIVERLDSADSQRLQLSDEIKDKVTLTKFESGLSEVKNYTDNEINSLDIGSENLLLDSERRSDFSNNDTHSLTRFYLSKQLEIGKHYTFACNFITTDEKQSGQTSVYPYNPRGIRDTVDIKDGKIIYTFTAQSESTEFLVYKDVAGQSNVDLNVTIEKAILVEGNKVTGWSPAPEENEKRLSNIETSISQNGEEIQARVSKQDFNASRRTLSQVISEISATTKGINLSYDENGNIQSYTMDRNGIQLRGDKVDITVNKEFNVVANKVDNKVGKDEVINRLNLSPEGLDIDVNKVGIRGGDSTNYIYLSQDKIEMAGTFQRTFRGNTQKDNVFMRAQGGYLRFRNNNQNRSLYYSDFGISTYIDGDSSEASGTLQFFDYTYSPTNSVRGVTLNSAGGAIALNSERNRIVLDANATVNIESETSSIYIRPMKNNRAGTNEFRFWTKLNDSVADTDGVLSYGTITELVEKAPASYSFGAGIRFDKSPKSRYIYATDKDGNIGTGDFYARNLLGDWWAKNNNLYALVDPKEGKLRITDYNGYNNGNPNYRDLQCQHIQSNTIRTNVGQDFYIGVSSNELRVTNNLFWNGGNTGYKPVRASDFIKASSAEFKHDIKKWDYDALNVISNELQLYSYKYNDDEKETIHHGPVIGDGYDIPVEFVFNSGVNTNEMLSWALRAIQQLNEKINTLEEQINE
ncbi:phage tail spike protein [Staphylococcus haemolyticus]|uniref:phage tail spike protein n=1 Tax=Staphylococcus haemolyticus TaxID=1283 RepID=UPI0028873D73|nr:phage tail spike protein [Staphylococcus haemolyticus]MDT0704400.1 phage tail spike protein [Staphylococcus haemolyticus]